MASLTDKRIKNTYDGLLKTTDNDALGGSYKLITDGLGNSSNVYLGTGGNVGIGASPSTKLHITDNSDSIIRIQRTGSHDLQLNSDGTITATSTDIKLVASSYISFTADFSEHMRVTGLGNVGIGTTSPDQKLTINGGTESFGLQVSESDRMTMGADGDWNYIKGKSGNGFRFSTFSAGDVLTLTNAGNVGIGTTSPARNLHIHQNDSTLSYLQITNSTTGASGSDGVSFGITSDEVAVWNNRENTDTTISTNNTERLRITSAGNVGINTTSPQAGLHVNNDSFLVTNGSEKSVDIDSLTYIYRIGDIDGGESGSYMEIKGVYGDTIFHNTNVGIGTSSPSQKLEIRGETATHKLVSINRPASDVAALYIGNDSASPSNGIISSNYSDLIFGRDQSSVLTEHMRIKRDGNVGIGDTSPSAKLVVVGEIRSDKTANGVSFSSTGGGASFTAFDVFTATNGGLLRLYDENAQTVNIDGRSAGGNTYFNNGGNVGIGTTSPGEKLDVSGNIGLSGSIVDTNTNESIDIGVNDVWFEGKHTHSTFGVWARSPGNGQRKMGIDGGTSFMGLYTNSTEKVRIDTNGNVGIGTTSPKNTFAEKTLSVISSASNSQGMIEIGGNNTSDTFISGVSFTNEQSTDTSTFQRIAQIYAARDGANNKGRLEFNVHDGTSLISPMTIKSDGKVGIGTTSPGQKLHINESTANTVSYLRFSNAQTTNGFDIGVNTSNSAIFFNRDASPMIFATSNSERMRIDSSGNVGIGTTSPASKLHISDAAVIFTTTSTNGVSGFIHNVIGGGSALYRIQDNGTERMRIDSSGNVGIGTTSPSAKLTVDSGSNGVAGYINIDSQTFNRLKIGYSFTDAPSGIGAAQIFVDSSGNLDISSRGNIASNIQLYTSSGTSPSEVMRITSGGNVGIGTTSPNTTLEVGDCDSSANIADGNIAVKTKSNNTAIVIQEQEVGGAEQWGLGVNVDGDLIFTDSGTERIRFDDGTGNVGIGTSSPSEKLHVEGNIQVSGTFPKIVFSDSDNNPDFTLIGANGKFRVFDDTNDVDRFIIESDGGLFAPSLLGSSASNPDVRYDTTTGELYYNSSSIRYKEDVTDIESTIDKINKLRPVKFKVKESQQYTTGLIAEEVVEVIPEIVFEREIEGFDKPQIDGVAYNDLHAYYIKAIQEQQQMINDLKRRIEVLENK